MISTKSTISTILTTLLRNVSQGKFVAVNVFTAFVCSKSKSAFSFIQEVFISEKSLLGSVIFLDYFISLTWSIRFKTVMWSKAV